MKLMDMDRNKITQSTCNSAAENYQDKVMGLDLYNDTYDLFCELLEKKNADIL